MTPNDTRPSEGASPEAMEAAHVKFFVAISRREDGKFLAHVGRDHYEAERGYGYEPYPTSRHVVEVEVEVPLPSRPNARAVVKGKAKVIR